MIARFFRGAIDKFEPDGKYHANDVRDMIDASRRARLISRGTGLLAAAALLVAIGLVAPAAAHASVQPAVSAYTMTPRRMAASLAVLTALIGAIIGGRALARAASRQRWALVALLVEPIALVAGGLVVATAKGGLGTGNGLGGGVVAMLVGLIGMTLGGLALARSRRTG
jgi:hypothetical protein